MDLVLPEYPYKDITHDMFIYCLTLLGIEDTTVFNIGVNTYTITERRYNPILITSLNTDTKVSIGFGFKRVDALQLLCDELTKTD